MTVHRMTNFGRHILYIFQCALIPASSHVLCCKYFCTVQNYVNVNTEKSTWNICSTNFHTFVSEEKLFRESCTVEAGCIQLPFEWDFVSNWLWMQTFVYKMLKSLFKNTQNLTCSRHFELIGCNINDADINYGCTPFTCTTVRALLLCTVAH